LIDVAVIGAGAAGLSAARDLAASGLSVELIEARPRVGGRVHTLRDSAIAIPIELGAEFVHGTAPETRRLAREAGVAICDVNGDRFESASRGFRPLDDFWEQLNRVLQKLDAQRRPDRSFAEFLAERPGGRALARERVLAGQWVRGYQAADPERASERALADGGGPGDDEAEQRQARLVGGYDVLLTHLVRALPRPPRLGTIVTRIEWGRGTAELTTSTIDGAPLPSLRARAAVISIPLGVLQAPPDGAGAIELMPSLPKAKLDALAGLTEGHVVRVSVILDEPIWLTKSPRVRTGGRSLQRLAFVHPADGGMPVCWTTYPTDAPLLIAWFGGPDAESLSRRSREEIEARAVRSLAQRLHVGPRRFARHVRAVYMHNWSADPFSRGAYSYVVVGGADASRALARPVQGTLFFAGEAFDAEGRNGTVEGAIASGRRAARQVRRALGG
jgi:monoamine oxidase